MSDSERSDCDCTRWFDCPCNPPDPNYNHEKGEIRCANCFGVIGEVCESCRPVNTDTDDPEVTDS